MFNDNDWAKLLNKLLQLTESKKLSWDAGPEGAFGVSIGDALYVIAAEDADGQAPWTISARRRNGAEWQTLDQLTSVSTSNFRNDPRLLITHLREKIFRQSTNADAILSDLLGGLAEIENRPPE